MVRKCVGTEPTYRPATVNRARGRETQRRLGVTSAVDGGIVAQCVLGTQETVGGPGHLHVEGGGPGHRMAGGHLLEEAALLHPAAALLPGALHPVALLSHQAATPLPGPPENIDVGQGHLDPPDLLDTGAGPGLLCQQDPALLYWLAPGLQLIGLLRPQQGVLTGGLEPPAPLDVPLRL